MMEDGVVLKKRKNEEVEKDDRKRLRNPFDLYEDYANVVFDFDKYIDDILPQVYEPGQQNSVEARKAAVEAAAASAPPGMSVQKLEEKFRTVVCRHWIRGLCMKGENCEFLHQYDVDRMPLCRRGANCKVPDCPYRHVSEDDKPQCVFFQQGFCVHGLACRYRHLKLPAEKRPKIADFSLGIVQNRINPRGERVDSDTPPAGGGGGIASTNGQTDKGNNNAASEVGSTTLPNAKSVPNANGGPSNNEFYKISLCRHFAAGMCPYGDECHFAHGERELRPFRGRRNSGPPPFPPFPAPPRGNTAFIPPPPPLQSRQQQLST